MEKTMKARVQHKHDIEANWLKATNFTPLASEIIVYDSDESYDYPRIKIGDGEKNINDLPFIVDEAKISEIISNSLEEAKNSGEFDGKDGQNGISASLKIEYASSAWSNRQPTEWQDSIPTLTSTEKYLWARFTKTEGLSSSIWTGVVGVYGDKGDKGDTGEQGPKGDQGIQGDTGQTGERGAAIYFINQTCISSYDTLSIDYFILPEGAFPAVGDLAIYKDGKLGIISEINENNMITIQVKADLMGATGPKGQKGDKGDPGEPGTNAEIAGATARINTDIGTPSVQVTSNDGPDGKLFDFYFKNLKGEKGEKGNKGDKGDTGANGTPATHSWNGTVLTVTSESGTSSADLKGATGEPGKTAYQYAQEAGYNGTESEFANKMAQPIPNELADLFEDSEHRVVTDVEKATWDAKSDFSGSYNDLSDKPAIPSIDGLASTGYVDNAVKDKVDKDGNKVLSTNDYTTAEKNKLAGIAAGAEVNVNADWDATSGDAQILNKPTLGTMAAKNSVAKTDLVSEVQTSLGKADTALQPEDISDWAKASSKPSYTKSEVGLSNVDNAKQYSASNPPVVAQATAPSDTSVVWVDTDDNSVDEFQDAVNIALAQAKESGEFTPVRGVDYWTENDQESIIQQVIIALGTPVFGRVDTNNNIVLSGDLVEGVYTLKYEDADGNVTEIGTLNHTSIPEVTYTNLFNPSTAVLNQRMSGTSKTPKTENGYVMTAAIPVPEGTTMKSTYDESTPYIAVPSSMWSGSANIIGIRSDIGGYDGFVSVGESATIAGEWAKIPIYTQWGGTIPIESVVVSLYVKSASLVLSDIQNIEIYFNEIPE